MTRDDVLHEIGMVAAQAVGREVVAMMETSYTYSGFGENVAKAYLAARAKAQSFTEESMYSALHVKDLTSM